MRDRLNAVSLQLGARLLGWGKSLQGYAAALMLQRERLPVLIFFHGYALAHTIRSLVAARALRNRGYPVVLAGRGPHVSRVRQEGFTVHDVETLPQERMDRFVARGNYEYYDVEWIDRCVQSERTLIQTLRPCLVIHDMKPTAALSARLEGVDDARITQAYNQPGYRSPVTLPDYFPAASGPFDAYLADRAAEVGPQRSFQILADIPELHPPGRNAGYTHYVGPLLDRPDEPVQLDILNEGWDPSRPLVYLTCGSSGRETGYLNALIEALACGGYRVFVTTAGRWTPCRVSSHVRENVRIVDFLPGEWILARAHLLIGVVGIGTIYQALAHSVPVIGAPEHLDQEIHLSQVEAHGLGIKLDRVDLRPEPVLDAATTIMADLDRYRRRAVPFAQALERHADGSAVADLVDVHFAESPQKGQYHLDARTSTPASEFLRYLISTTPPDLDGSALEAMLSRGLSRGMPHAYHGGQLHIDHWDGWNWLNEREPRFFEADYRALENRRAAFFVRRNGCIRSRTQTQHYRATYSLRLLPEPGDPLRRLRLFLPYPVERPGHQTQVRLLHCQPAGMAANLAPNAGFVYGYETELGSEPVDFSYTCQYTVRELSPDHPLGPAQLSAAEAQKYLALDPRITQLPEVIQFCRNLNLSPDAGAMDKARAVYDALMSSRCFRKTRDSSHHPVYCTAAVLRQEGAHCITLARAYISLCRSLGIPAREVTGALMGYPAGEGRYERRAYGEPVYGHMWAEIHLADTGWLPVEFHSLVIGHAALTEDNVRDRQLRRTIKASTAPFVDYYFGCLDHQRIVCSGSVRTMDQWLVEDPTQDAECGERRWKPAHDLRHECSLCIEPI